MPLSEAVGVLSLAETYLAATIEACALWQTLTGSRSSIYYDELPEPPNNQAAYTRAQLEQLRPFIIINTEETTALELTHTATTGPNFVFRGSGRLEAMLEMNVDAEIAHDGAEVLRRFKNDVGALLAQMVELFGQAGYLAAVRIVGKGPYRCHDDLVTDEGDHCWFHFTFDWGRK